MKITTSSVDLGEHCSMVWYKNKDDKPLFGAFYHPNNKQQTKQCGCSFIYGEGTFTVDGVELSDSIRGSYTRLFGSIEKPFLKEEFKCNDCGFHCVIKDGKVKEIGN